MSIWNKLVAALLLAFGPAMTQMGWAKAGESSAVERAVLEPLFARQHCWRNRLEMQAWFAKGAGLAFSGGPWLAKQTPDSARWLALTENGETAAAHEKHPACIVDRLTGLQWAIGLVPKTPLPLAAAAAPGEEEQSVDKLILQANGRRFCGVDQWRLPARNELHSLADYLRPEASDGPPFFGAAGIGGYWTSTPLAGGPHPVYPVGVDARGQVVMGEAKWVPQRWVVKVPYGTMSPESIDGRHLALLVKETACHALGWKFWK